MAIVVGADSVGSGIRYLLPVVTGIYVLADADVVSTDASAIVGTGVIHKVTVAGHVFGDVDGVALGDNPTQDSFERVTVLAGATVSGGDDAIEISANQSSVSNYGTLSGAYGINLSAYGTGQSRVVNAGVITASAEALHFVGDETKVVINTGTIDGGVALISLHNSIDMITNRGLMIGDVHLGPNNDVFDGRGGTVLGLVDGGDGADRILPGLAVETIDGGLGSDTLDFRSSAGVHVALEGGFLNTGEAAGDSYSGIEVLWGSDGGADWLGGNGVANTLRGYSGADSLSGAAGADYLVGGVGIDTLNGGLGNDQFWFERATDGGDIVQDFHNVATTDDDRFRISVAGFGGGLVAGALAASQLQSRADNLAQDLDDRFIFRTTDATLWFDANGTGAGGLSLLADLQAGVTLAATDFLLV